MSREAQKISRPLALISGEVLRFHGRSLWHVSPEDVFADVFSVNRARAGIPGLWSKAIFEERVVAASPVTGPAGGGEGRTGEMRRWYSCLDRVAPDPTLMARTEGTYLLRSGHAVDGTSFMVTQEDSLYSLNLVCKTPLFKISCLLDFFDYRFCGSRGFGVIPSASNEMEVILRTHETNFDNPSVGFSLIYDVDISSHFQQSP